jgi:agmatine/peptidylarginine deiminase
LRLFSAWTLLFLVSPVAAQQSLPPTVAASMTWSRPNGLPAHSWTTTRRVSTLPNATPATIEHWNRDASAYAAGTQEPPPQYRLPGEFERQGTIFFGSGELATFYPDLLADLVEAVRHRIDVAALVNDANGRQAVAEILARRGLPADAVRCIETPHDTMWIRDYGPLFVRRIDDGRAVVVDADYERFARPKDDSAPQALASQLRLTTVRAPISMEGGNLLSNGRGLCLTTTTLIERNRQRGHTEDEVCRMIREYFGAQQTIVLEPLAGEATGHVDMFAVFTDPGTVVVGQYDAEAEPENAAILDRNAARLASIRGANGPLTVVRIPMPPRNAGYWPTYTNVVFVNGLLLTPIYGSLDAHGQIAAMETYAKLLPGWRVMGIDVSGLIANGGALHCISMNAPRLVGWPASATLTRQPEISPLSPIANRRSRAFPIGS